METVFRDIEERAEESTRGRILVTAINMTVNPTPPFDFELSAMIFSEGDPQIRKYEKGEFWQVIRAGSKLILLTITNAGTVEEPKLSVRLESDQRISNRDREKGGKTVRTLFNLDFDVKPFYEQTKEDNVMTYLTRKLRGLKSPTTPTVFEALIDSIVEQQISLIIANTMEERLIKSFGKVLSLNKQVYYAFPTPQEFASASIQTLRSCGLSQRKAEYIKDVSKMVTDGKLCLEKLKGYEDANDIIAELDGIRGIGIWTAEMTMVRGMQRMDAFPADDVGLRRVISHYYCGDGEISSEEARKIAEKWGKWKGLVSFYLIVAAAKDIRIH
ncbi:MAG TPA: DNA-3-methyladenine glycosylase [candidate division Zixibacteria bacterium]|nr:DNA-3-methyladenine glycosylase [candidate division Zixibacteria bacterium]